MTETSRKRLSLAVAAVLSLLGCMDTSRITAGQLAFDISALSLSGVTDVTYTLRVARGNPDGTAQVDSDDATSTVWTRTVASSAYGTPDGALTFIGACDASDQNPSTPQFESDNTVYLVLDQINAPTPLTAGVDFINPCPVSAPCIRTAACLENQDTSVTYNLTVMRRANQGFFDVAVNFQDIFCSGKVDCSPALLHDSTGGRARTTIAAFACTAGADLDNDPTNDTHLFANDLVIHCKNGANTDSISILDMAATGGKHDADSAITPPEAVDTYALYGGIERIEGYKKGYWNLAFTLAANQTDCVMTGAATAAAGNWPTGTSPSNTMYPVILFDDIELGAASATCHPAHPLDGPGSDVHTAYTPDTSQCFGNVGVIQTNTLARSDTSCGSADPCTSDNGGCHALSTCYDAGGRAYCGPCPSGYSGSGATGCVDINECTLGTDNCDPIVTCTNTPGAYTCGNCPSGYTGSGTSGCIDINECATNNGNCDSLTTCTNTPGSRTCSACPSGYSGTGETGCIANSPPPSGDPNSAALVIQQDSISVSVTRTGRLNVLAARPDGTWAQFGAPTRYASVTSSDPACVSVPSSVYLYSPSSSRTFTVTAQNNLCSATITVSDSVLGTDTAIVNVVPLPDLGTLTIANAEEYRVGASLQTVATLSIPITTLSSADGTISVTVTSSDPASVQLSTTYGGVSAPSLTFGLSRADASVTFYVRALPGAVGNTVTLLATHPRCDDGTADFTVVNHVFRLDDVITSRAVSSTQVNSDDPFRIDVGILNTSNTFIYQRVGTSLPVTLSVTPPVAGNTSLRVWNGTTAALSQTISLPVGNYVFNSTYSPSLGFALRLATNPNVGNYLLSASTGDSLSSYSGSQKTITVSVATSTITLTDQDSRGNNVGTGLQSYFRVDLTSGHPAMTVRFESSDPSRLVISSSATTAGTGTLDVPISSSTNRIYVYFQSLAGASTGPVIIRTTAPGYIDAETTLQLVNPIVEVLGINTSASHTGTRYEDTGNDEIYFGVRIPVGANYMSQAVSAAAGPLQITVVKSASPSATLQTLTASGDTVSTAIAVNQTMSPTSYSAGGVRLDFTYPATPLGTSSFSCTASVPNGAANALSTFSITRTITEPTLSWHTSYGNPGDRIGGGMSLDYRVTLDEPYHKGVTLRVSSSNPSVALIASASSSVNASSSMDFNINDGISYLFFHIHGVTGQTGTSVVTVECITPGCMFNSLSKTVTIVPVIATFSNLNTTQTTYSIDTLATADVFTVTLQIRNGNNALEDAVVAGSMAPFSVEFTATSALDSHLRLSKSATDTPASSIIFDFPTGAGVTSALRFNIPAFLPAGVYPTTITATPPGTDPNRITTASVNVTSYQAYLDLVASYDGVPHGLMQRYTLQIETSSGTLISSAGTVSVLLTHSAGAFLATSFGGTRSQSLTLSFNDGSEYFYMMGGDLNEVSASLDNAIPDSLSLAGIEPAFEINRSGSSNISTWTWSAGTSSGGLGVSLRTQMSDGTQRRSAFAPFEGYAVNFSAEPSSLCYLNTSTITVPAGESGLNWPVIVNRVIGSTGVCSVTVSSATRAGAPTKTLTITMN